MPTIWKYLYKQFLKVFLLTVSSFILILIVTRLKEIARLIALTPDIGTVACFILNIIPFILPIAVPIACLVSAILLFQKLSHSHELTALRCAGYSLISIMFPILSLALVLSLANFCVVSELTSHSQIFSRHLINKLITENPLYLLEHKDKLHKKDFYLDMNVRERGKLANNVLIITANKESSQFNLVEIEKLQVEGGALTTPSMNVISIIDPKGATNEKHMIVENEKNVRTTTNDLTQIMHSTYLHLQPHHLSMPFLKISLKEKKQWMQDAIQKRDHQEIKRLKHLIDTYYSEMSRRISIGLAVFTFTLLGISYSIKIGRSQNKKKLITMCLLATFGLVCFFVGKIFHNYFWLASLIYFTPHVLLVTLSSLNLSRIMRGIE